MCRPGLGPRGQSSRRGAKGSAQRQARRRGRAWARQEAGRWAKLRAGLRPKPSPGRALAKPLLQRLPRQLLGASGARLLQLLPPKLMRLAGKAGTKSRRRQPQKKLPAAPQQSCAPFLSQPWQACPCCAALLLLLASWLAALQDAARAQRRSGLPALALPGLQVAASWRGSAPAGYRSGWGYSGLCWRGGSWLQVVAAGFHFSRLP